MSPPHKKMDDDAFKKFKADLGKPEVKSPWNAKAHKDDLSRAMKSRNHKIDGRNTKKFWDQFNKRQLKALLKAGDDLFDGKDPTEDGAADGSDEDEDVDPDDEADAAPKGESQSGNVKKRAAVDDTPKGRGSGRARPASGGSFANATRTPPGAGGRPASRSAVSGNTPAGGASGRASAGASGSPSGGRTSRYSPCSDIDIDKFITNSPDSSDDSDTQVWPPKPPKPPKLPKLDAQTVEPLRNAPATTNSPAGSGDDQTVQQTAPSPATRNAPATTNSPAGSRGDQTVQQTVLPPVTPPPRSNRPPPPASQPATPAPSAAVPDTAIAQTPSSLIEAKIKELEKQLEKEKNKEAREKHTDRQEQQEPEKPQESAEPEREEQLLALKNREHKLTSEFEQLSAQSEDSEAEMLAMISEFQSKEKQYEDEMEKIKKEYDHKKNELGDYRLSFELTLKERKSKQADMEKKLEEMYHELSDLRGQRRQVEGEGRSESVRTDTDCAQREEGIAAKSPEQEKKEKEKATNKSRQEPVQAKTAEHEQTEEKKVTKTSIQELVQEAKTRFRKYMRGGSRLTLLASVDPTNPHPESLSRLITEANTMLQGEENILGVLNRNNSPQQAKDYRRGRIGEIMLGIKKAEEALEKIK